MKIKVLSYNIHKGFSPIARDYTLKAIKEKVRELHIDVVFLQEVLGLHNKYAETVEEWDPRPQFEYLADDIWQHYCYGKNAVYTEGHHGNAILSHFPIASWQNTDISTNRFEQRGFLHARIQMLPLHVHLNAICTHLNLLESGRLPQVTALAEYINKYISPNEPLIVAGDFNDWTGKSTKILEDGCGLRDSHKTLHGDYGRTFPVYFPFMRLDRILVRNCTTLGCVVLDDHPWRDLSDHAAMFSELELVIK
jgi:endonuclease/exonuclease/phosphatase family metal-dependent hydrolase